MFWCDDNKEADLVGFTKHYNAGIIIKILLSINCIIKLSSFITAIQYKFTLWQLQLVTQYSHQQQLYTATTIIYGPWSTTKRVAHIRKRSAMHSIQSICTASIQTLWNSHDKYRHINISTETEQKFYTNQLAAILFWCKTRLQTL